MRTVHSCGFQLPGSRGFSLACHRFHGVLLQNISPNSHSGAALGCARRGDPREIGESLPIAIGLNEVIPGLRDLGEGSGETSLGFGTKTTRVPGAKVPEGKHSPAREGKTRIMNLIFFA